MEEFSLDVECPHCGAESTQHIDFDFRESDQSGCDSGIRQRDCYECDKKYWVSARVNFEVEISEIYAKKPKSVK